jgi:hypothetical protein
LPLLRDFAHDHGARGFGQAADFVARVLADPRAVGQGNADQDGFFETNGQLVAIMIE